MSMTAFRKIVSVIISAVLVLPLFACSAEKPVRELYDAYVSEKDSVIREKTAEETGKEEKASVPEDTGTEQVLTAGLMPDPVSAPEEPAVKKEVRTSVETVRSEVVPEVEKEPEEKAPVQEAEPAPVREELPPEPMDELNALKEEAEAFREITENAETAPASEEKSAPAPLGGGAVTLAPGSGGGQLLKLDEEGTLLTLTAQETIYDVSVGSSAGLHQYDDSFRSDRVEAGTAITLQALIRSDEPDISISWTSAEGYGYLKYISVSAKDGVPMLVAVE